MTDSVFISYSNNDVDVANEIANTLKNNGINVWIDTINGKDDIAKQEAIKSAKQFLIITSSNAINDETLVQEKDFARKNRVERILVKVEACDTDIFRWDSLTSIDLSSNKEEGIKILLEKCGERKGVVKSTPQSKKDKVIEKVEETVQEQNIIVPKTPEAIKTTTSNSEDLLRKESLLVSDEDIDNVRSIVKNQLRGARNQTYIYIAGAVGLIILVLTNGSFKEMFSASKEEVDGALDFLEKFYPGITAALPTVISGGSFKKLKEYKQNIALVNQIKSKRDRMKDAIATFSEPEIVKLEEDLGKLIKF